MGLAIRVFQVHLWEKATEVRGTIPIGPHCAKKFHLNPIVRGPLPPAAGAAAGIGIGIAAAGAVAHSVLQCLTLLARCRASYDIRRGLRPAASPCPWHRSHYWYSTALVTTSFLINIQSRCLGLPRSRYTTDVARGRLKTSLTGGCRSGVPGKNSRVPIRASPVARYFPLRWHCVQEPTKEVDVLCDIPDWLSGRRGCEGSEEEGY